jgi:hypothetical protein
MKFTTVTSALLLAGSAVAAPGTALRRARALDRQSKPINRVATDASITNKTNVEYSSNWAGAILIGTGYTSVTGTFTVPTPTTTGSGSVSTLFFWVDHIPPTFNARPCFIFIYIFGYARADHLTRPGLVLTEILAVLQFSRLELIGLSRAPASLTMRGMSGTQTTHMTSLALPSQLEIPSPSL